MAGRRERVIRDLPVSNALGSVILGIINRVIISQPRRDLRTRRDVVAPPVRHPFLMGVRTLRLRRLPLGLAWWHRMMTWLIIMGEAMRTRGRHVTRRNSKRFDDFSWFIMARPPLGVLDWALTAWDVAVSLEGGTPEKKQTNQIAAPSFVWVRDKQGLDWGGLILGALSVRLA